MTRDVFERTAKETIERLEHSAPAKTYTEVVGKVHAKMDSERMLELVKVFDSLEEEEIQYLKSFQAFQKPYGDEMAKSIKEKYSLSWNELNTIKDMVLEA